MRGKSRKYVIADSALKRIQVDAWAFWLDTDEHIIRACTSEAKIGTLLLQCTSLLLALLYRPAVRCKLDLMIWR